MMEKIKFNLRKIVLVSNKKRIQLFFTIEIAIKN